MITSQDQMPRASLSFPEKKRLDAIESLYALMSSQSRISMGIDLKFFMSKKTKENLHRELHERIAALTLAINILKKVCFKDDAYPFELEGMVTSFYEEGNIEPTTHFTPVKEDLSPRKEVSNA